jgi:hypothetical protein
MKIYTVITLFAATLLSHAEPAALFNGKDLTGWKVNGENCWKVIDGVIQGENDPNKKGSILWTEKSYSNFVFQCEFKFDGNIDSGVFLRHEIDQIQIGISGSLKRDMTASPYISSKKSYPVEATGVAELLKVGEWNAMKITVKGSLYKVELNGKEVMTYTSETAIENGPIGLQMHPGRVMKILFRNLTLEAP